MTHKIVFLDLDGVLLTLQPDKPGYQFSKEAVAALNFLTGVSGAEVVVSSSRRETLTPPNLRSLLESAGVTGYVVGCTPHISVFGRAGEIQFFVDEHRLKIASWVVLDDDPSLAEELGIRLVMVDERVGLTLENAKRAAQILGL